MGVEDPEAGVVTHFVAGLAGALKFINVQVNLVFVLEGGGLLNWLVQEDLVAVMVPFPSGRARARASKC